MNNENKKVISIRLVYVLLVLAIILAIIFGTTKYFSIKTNEVAENIEQEDEKIASINREEKVDTTSRSEEITRNQENNIEQVEIEVTNQAEDQKNTEEKNEII